MKRRIPLKPCSTTDCLRLEYIDGQCKKHRDEAVYAGLVRERLFRWPGPWSGLYDHDAERWPS